ncbi:hypothetical protein J2857_004121 [Neorhizobium galegae]|nr:hypothetical protein [Neorhizobium galegae]
MTDGIMHRLRIELFNLKPAEFVLVGSIKEL